MQNLIALEKLLVVSVAVLAVSVFLILLLYLFSSIRKAKVVDAPTEIGLDHSAGVRVKFIRPNPTSKLFEVLFSVDGKEWQTRMAALFVNSKNFSPELIKHLAKPNEFDSIIASKNDLPLINEAEKKLFEESLKEFKRRKKEPEVKISKYEGRVF